jgi:hypothetical protein
MRVAGANKTSARVSCVDPATQQKAASNIKMALVYYGIRASAPSNCCACVDASNQTRFGFDFRCEAVEDQSLTE